MKTLPGWAVISLATNGLLVSAACLLWVKSAAFHSDPSADPSNVQISVAQSILTPLPQLGPRHQLSYQQWVKLLEQEAQVVVEQQPKRLTVVLGDSLSLWFPNHLLLPHRHWLNQGISGETTAGLLKRLDLLERTQPETIFVMIGINDLIRGVKEETLLANWIKIIRQLQKTHPETQIVVQSILPHGGEETTWEGRDRLLQISNSQIRGINERLKAIAATEGVYYIDLYSLFADADGNLQPSLSTDGLHLSEQGYLVWRTAIGLYSEIVLNQREFDRAI